MPFRRRKKYKTSYKKNSLSKQALALAKANRRKLIENRPELKVRDGGSTAALTTVTTSFAFNSIARGDSESERIGDEVKVQKLHQQQTIQWNSNSVTPQIIRVLNVVWNETAAFNTDSVMDASDSVLSFLQPLNLGKFNVLTNDVYIVHEYKPMVYIEKHIPYKGKILYDGSGGANYAEGMIFTVIICESITNMPTVETINRTRYTDP